MIWYLESTLTAVQKKNWMVHLYTFLLRKDILPVHYYCWKTRLSTLIPLALFAALFLLLSGCTYTVNNTFPPAVPEAPSYSPADPSGDMLPHHWWTVFDDPKLNASIDKALSDNFTLKKGYARMSQALHSRKKTASLLYPQLDSNFSGTSTWFSGESQENRNNLTLDLSWEIDFWGKLSSADKAALFDFEAGRDDVETVALLLSSQVADNYFQLIEQKLQLELLEKQIKVHETFLDLITLRFANGAASVVDVYQQRQLLAADRAKMPLIHTQIATLGNRLDILMGMAPVSTSLPTTYSLPSLPPIPLLGVPADLLQNRPDLRMLHKNLLAADHRVAAAVADRLPQITIGGTGGLLNGDLFLTLFGDAFASIVNWGSLKGEVEKQKAVVQEILADYSQSYITAIEEVENALVTEKNHMDLLKALDDQLIISQATLKETRNQYMQGLTDYLPVLSALVSLQNLERDILTRHRQLISIRILLYRALGGAPILDAFPPATG
ncbi:MAG: TolC family protein [Desulfobulbaceae bacterium]|uniref:TolC family protein n=1 Tax=Candidatus Desulfobia pelagia TaxID=2841692 RepID=A0A8J6NF19_9BACT|nr:TolC family protein [Candidatus Desulfobia pelagia]